MLTAALLGFGIGFVTSMPVAGPISLLVFGRGLQGKGRSGASLAFGSAIAESMYAYLAFWGFSALLARYAWIEPVSRGLTAVLLTALGVRFARMHTAAPSEEQPVTRQVGVKRSFFLGLTITALNPTLIATWSVVVAALHSFDVVSFGSDRALPFAFMLTGRAENHIRGNPDLDDTIARLQAYEAAGADVLYAPGLAKADEIRAVCAAVDRPVNVLATRGLTFAEMAAAGAQRVSVGGALTWTAANALVEAATAIRDHGDFSLLGVSPRLDHESRPQSA